MAVALRSVGISPGSRTSCVIVKPIGLTSGDLMVAQISWGTGVGTPSEISPPEDWTEIRQDSGNKFRLASFWKIADSDDVSATNFTFTGGGLGISNIGAISAWTGHDSTSPINANNGQYNASSATITSPTITPSVASCMILLLCGVCDNNTQSGYAIDTSNPASWTEAYDINTNVGADSATAMGYAIRPEISATGDGTATSSGSDINVGQLIAIAPAAVAAAGRSFGFIFG